MKEEKAPFDEEELQKRVRGLEITCLILTISIIILATGSILITLKIARIIDVISLISQNIN